MPLMQRFSLQPLPPFRERLATVKRVADIVEHLHSLPGAVLHGDIKPENLVVRPATLASGTMMQTQILLTDFGSAFIKRTQTAPLATSGVRSTVGYRHPAITTGLVAYEKVRQARGTIQARVLCVLYWRPSSPCRNTTCSASP